MGISNLISFIFVNEMKHFKKHKANARNPLPPYFISSKTRKVGFSSPVMCWLKAYHTNFCPSVMPPRITFTLAHYLYPMSFS